MFHKLKSVRPLENYILEVFFKIIHVSIMILVAYLISGRYSKNSRLTIFFNK